MISSQKQIFQLSSISWLSSLLVLCVGCGPAAPKQENLDLAKKNYTLEKNRVEAVVLKRANFEKQLVSNGKLSALEKSVLAFKTPGKIAQVYVKNGEVVDAGEVLARLEDTELRSAVEQAQQGVEKAQIEFQDVLIGFGQNGNDTTQVPKEMLRTAAIRSGYLAAQTTLKETRQALAHAELKAPFAGKVANVILQANEQVKEEFCTLINDRILQVDFSILETELSFVHEGQRLRVSPLNNPTAVLTGKITQINPTVDKTGQIQLRAEVPNNGLMLDGMNVRVLVEQTLGNQLVVPKSAVVIRDNLEVLFRLREGKAQWTYVNTLMTNSDSYVVTANLSRGAELNVGDSIIVSGNLNLADGSVVELVPSK